MKSLKEFLSYHYKKNDDWRLGQRFCNWYITKPWPELFYCADEQKAIEMIEQWLVDHQYIETLPEVKEDMKWMLTQFS